MKTLIIAEIGVNHNGDLNIARALIDAAVEAGADFVKFQTFCADRLVTSTAAKADYQKQTTTPDETQYAMLKKLELSDESHHILFDYCKKQKISCFSTGFDIQNIQFLADIGQECFKIPSGEITNLPYLRHIGHYGKPVILSSGMSTLGEIESALHVLVQSGTTLDDITVLHCTTEYPTPMQHVNLRAMKSINKAFGVKVGYSDHTKGIEVAVAAVALGASIIEKHITLDCNLPGPDHKASIEPEEFKNMVRAIRNIELALGTGRKFPTHNELKNREVARKSIVASRKITQGEIFTHENMIVKRPGLGISPMYWDDIAGKKANREYELDDLIEF